MALFTYNTNTDWAQFVVAPGSPVPPRVYGNQLKLGHWNASDQLGLSNMMCRYCFGQNAGTSTPLHNDFGYSSDGTTESFGLGSLVVDEQGIHTSVSSGSIDSSNFADVAVGGNMDDYSVLDSVAPVTSSTISFWTKLPLVADIPAFDWWTESFETIFGFDFVHAYDAGGYYTLDDSASFAVGTGLSDRVSGLLLCILPLGGYGPPPPAQPAPTRVVAVPLGFCDGNEHCITLHAFWVVDPSDSTQGNQYFRCYIDGRFIGDIQSVFSYGTGAHYTTTPKPFILAPHDGTGLKPSMLALAQSNGGSYGSYVAGWGTRTVAYPCRSTLDELVLAHSDPVPLSPLTITDIMVDSPAWSVGDQILPVITRFASVAAETYLGGDFVYYGPVEDAGSGLTDLINSITPILTNFSPSGTGYDGHIDVSVRSSASSFTQTSTGVAWSDWHALNDGVATLVGSGSAARYTQIRVRMYPNADGTCLGISELVLDTTGTDEWDDHADLSCSIVAGSYSTLPASITVSQAGTADLSASIQAVYVGTPACVAAQITVKTFSYLTATVFVRGHAQLAASIDVTIASDHADLAASVTVIHHTADLPARIIVPSHAYLSGSITIPIHLIPCRITVERRGAKDLLSEIFVLPEAPGAVTGLSCDLPTGVWQTTSAANFTWGIASHLLYPISGYYYHFSKTLSMSPTTSWSMTTGLGASVSMPTAGKWYFSVAARNSVGYFGSVSTLAVWFNHPPSTPGTSLMQVNTQDTKTHAPLIPMRPVIANAFSWSAASDPDSGDVVFYELQIATRPDFAFDPSTGRPSLVTDLQNCPSPSQIWSPAPQPGLFFWRIRANDTKQSSAWSSVGSFVVNAPPGKPSNLGVHQR